MHRYSFSAGAGHEYAVFLEAVEGSVALQVVDSITREIRGTTQDGQFNERGLYEVATEGIPVSADRVFTVELRRYDTTVTKHYNFLAYEVVLEPELRPARFAIGDTISEERLDPLPDVDEFVAAGQAGQEIAGIAYGLSISGPGMFGLSITNPASGAQLGFARGVPGGPGGGSIASGRFTLPASGDYRFTVRGMTFVRYVGAYTFRFHTINRAPETAPSSIAANTEIAGESIDVFGDIDEFTVSTPGAGDYNVFFQGNALREAQLEVLPPGSAALTPLLTVPADTGLFQHATGRFTVVQAGTMTLRVSGLSDLHMADTGAYRFYVYAVNPLPEHVTGIITPGDTISESIDLPGDIDEFSFTAPAGAEFNVLFQPQVASGAVLRAEISGPAGAIASVEGYGPAPDLYHLVSGRFAVPVAGTYRVRVTGAGSTTPLHTGPYRLFLYGVDRHPESVPEALTLGDSVSSEAIDLPGDIDEFKITVPDSIGAAVALQIDAAPGIGEVVRATVFPPTGDSLGYVNLFAPGAQGGVGFLHLGPGTHTIRVQGIQYDNRSVIRTRYQLWAYRFRFEPEVAADTFAIGDTVSGESIDVPGDLDRFYFYATRGQLVNVAFQGLNASSSGAFQLQVSTPERFPFLFIVSPTSAPALGDHQTTRLDLPFTGWYQIDILGSTAAVSRLDLGPYRFAVEPLDPGPEQVGPGLVPGDSITTESIDWLGDWDQFTVTAPAGSEVAVFFSATPPDFNYPRALVFDSLTGDAFFELAGLGSGQTGPILVPGSGRLAVAVREYTYTSRFCYDATCGGLFHFVGPYQLGVVSVNRVPESVGAAYTVGDTVRAESISPLGDIDEFTGSATPGATLQVFYRMAATTVPADGSIQLTIIDPATDGVLIGSGYAAVNQAYFSPGSFTVPASGNFRVRIRAYPATSVTTVPYEFVIRP